MRIVRAVTLGMAVALAGGVLGGCADTRLKKLTAGIPRDSAVAIMGVEKPHRTDTYLIKGQYIEAMYYARPGKNPSDSIPDRKLSPIIVVNGTLRAWGWPQWDSIAGANGIIVAK